MPQQFTREEVIRLAAEKYGDSVCLDFIEEAMEEDTLEAAAQVVIDGSWFWDSYWWWEQ